MRSSLAEFRKHKDHYFLHGDNSPLYEEELNGFAGLDYFEENPALVFDLDIDSDVPGVGELVAFPTSDGAEKYFYRSGKIRFEVDGAPVELTVFRDPDRGRHFLPFTDATTGKTTYEAGRYLDPQHAGHHSLHIDFNYAYNPYCAYSDEYSCPLPPPENALPVEIRAGEKGYKRGQPGS